MLNFKIYEEWIIMNSYNILNESDNIKYVYFMIKSVLNKGLDGATFDMFKKSNKDMDGLFTVLCKLIGNKITVDITVNKQSENKKDSHKEKKTVKQNIVKSDDSDDDFHDANNNDKSESEESTNEHSENYNSGDDSDGVYKKAMKNTQIRTTRRILKGGKMLLK
jgi:hypothetical protein